MNKSFTCEKCGFKAKNERVLKGHKTGHLIKCDLCQNVFKTYGLLRRHDRTQHARVNQNRTQNQNNSNFGHTMKCTVCNFVAKTNIQLQNHMNIRHGNSPRIDCTLCDFTAASQLQLEKHNKVRHDKSTTNLQCRFWMRGFCSKGDQCRFKHITSPPCRYGWYCPCWPNCRFSHQDVLICKFQEFCENPTCEYAHFLGGPKQVQPQPPLKNFQNFPLLNNVGLSRPW